MRKILFGLLVSLLLATQLWAAGTATVSSQKVMVLNQIRRVILTISWTDDTAGTTLEINPATYDITGFYLFSATTNPGSTAPQDNYDITLVDADGVDIATGDLMNRDSTSSEEIKYLNAPIKGTFTFTLSGNNVNNATGTCILVFTAD